MIGKSNIGGSGVVSSYAAIGVQYTPGQTCTCSDGVNTYTALDTSGYVIFNIRKNGTYTITDGIVTRTVTIDHKGQAEILKIKNQYLFTARDEIVLYNDGQLQYYTQKTYPDFEIYIKIPNGSGTGWIRTVSGYDLTYFNTLVLKTS